MICCINPDVDMRDDDCVQAIDTAGHEPHGPKSEACAVSQVEFVVAFIGTTLARAVAAPLNSNYKKVGVLSRPTARHELST